LAFIKATQPDEWAYLEGIQKAEAEETLLDDLCRALDPEHEGCLSVREVEWSNHDRTTARKAA
jgi:hypothetical protein